MAAASSRIPRSGAVAADDLRRRSIERFATTYGNSRHKPAEQALTSIPADQQCK